VAAKWEIFFGRSRGDAVAGRRRKPTAVKELAGNPGKRPLNKQEPRPRTAGTPKAPVFLGRYGKMLWDRIGGELEQLGILSSIDLTAFEALCGAYDQWRLAAAAVKKHGQVYVKDGIVRMRPEVRIAEFARKELRQLAAEFGLTPAARPRVAASLADASQPALPGAEQWPEQEDPDKPQLPEDRFTDDDYFGVRETTH
jgi:P27 family predicted phage terminase small subunit